MCLLIAFLVRPLLLPPQHELHQDGLSITNPDVTVNPRGAISFGLDITSTVDTLTGTGLQATLPADYNGGETFPGADVPFGMVQWSPDTVSVAYSGYKYSDDRIRGFSLTHLSGAGCSEYGTIPFMPYTGSLPDNPGLYHAIFSHANETGQAGYYRVKLDTGVTTELTVTQHSGAARLTYPAGGSAGLLVNLGSALKTVNDAQALLGNDTLAGWVSSGDFCSTRHNTYRLYFWAQFSQPFLTSGFWNSGGIVSDQTAIVGPTSGAFVTFNTNHQHVINVRVGISYVSIANAEANVNRENPAGSFDWVHQQAMQTWSRWLNEIQINGSTALQRVIFYTALYHALLYPSIFSDVNGQYTGFDGQVHTAPPGHAQYANFSGWDIYRSEAQLLTLLAPSQASDMAQSLINDYTQSGGLPKWPVANGESYVQVGDPAAAIIADIYAFGGTDFDTHAALSALIRQATQSNVERPGLDYLQTYGYEPLDGSYGCCNFYGAASTTLEYATADFAISTLAGALGDSADAQKFEQRAQNWHHLFNPATGYLEPRYLNGAFPTSYLPTSSIGWVEGNSAQYTWMVPFNLHGLFMAMGGNASVLKRLDTFFTDLNAGPQAPYAFLGNEPTLEVPWEYDYAGAPSKTQTIVRKAVTTLYSPGPYGLPGNEDLGEMSSWFIFATLGMYPEIPGTADLVLASPLFPLVILHRPGGQTISISAPNASVDTPYVQYLLVNGQPSSHPWLPASFIVQGGTLEYTLTSIPSPSWGSAASDAPPSFG